MFLDFACIFMHLLLMGVAFVHFCEENLQF